MVTITNGILTAKFNEIGAELKSLACDGEEYIWHGDKTFWEGSAPVLFPICSGLKNDTYYYNGKSYKMKKHGYASECIFDVVQKNESSVTFKHTYNAETLKCYPFKYELLISYELIDKKLNITYKVNNLTNGNMYFSIGAHEGFLCEGGIQDYEIIFPKNVTLDAFELEGSILGYNTSRVLADTKILPLDYKYFKVDAIILKSIDFQQVILKSRKTGKSIKSTFNGFPYLLFWSKQNAPLVCIEPWCGITDSIDTTQDITVKEGIQHLKQGENFERVRTIEILG